MNDSEKREVLHKELDLIQSVITRMAQNSFMIKGWYFSLIIVITAFKIENILYYSLLVILLSASFYFINLKFYIYEKKFRDVYYDRIELRKSKEDYSTNLYSLKFRAQDKSEKKKNDYWEYGKQNKMLCFTYFGVCTILILLNCLVNADTDSGKIVIEISGLKDIFK